ncbi:MAG TPA: NAD(P)-dependent oxidoreductase [Methylomirabilota bacterium]|jgi:malate dehydrogenase (oxaloacetate-decarboxylating)|nr:NAD(P)-dependent oxidoreductase [Methylomirabilota bacterium]
MENDHTSGESKHLRLSLPNVSGALTRVTAAVSGAGGIVGEVHRLHDNPRRRLVELDIVAASEDQWAAILQALGSLEHVQIEGESNPALDAHRGGLIGVQPLVSFRSDEDFTTFYTSGATSVAQSIAQAPHLAQSYTAIPRLVALVTTGEAVPSLGDIGPQAAMPLLEGKAVLLNTVTTLSGVPILIGTSDPAEIVRTLAHIAPTFAAISLEGIAAPACFAVEEVLSARLRQPVWHDDQHGAAVVVVAAVFTLARRSRRALTRLRVGLVGLGAAGIGIIKLLRAAGVRHVLGVDPCEHACRRFTHLGGSAATLAEVMQEAEVVVATTGAPGPIRPELMRRGQALLALAHLTPEMMLEVARVVGAPYVADGRRLTSALVFPGLLRGTLDAGSRQITDAMKLAAAEAIAQQSEGPLLLPSALDPVLHLRVACAVRDSARRARTAHATSRPPSSFKKEESHDVA